MHQRTPFTGGLGRYQIRLVAVAGRSTVWQSAPLEASTWAMATLGMVTMMQVAQLPAASLALSGLMPTVLLGRMTVGGTEA